MKEYHKIITVFKRNERNNYKTMIEGKYSLEEFEYLKNNKWIFTEKIDGILIRIIFKKEKNEIIIKGKSDNASIPTFLLENIMNLIDKQKFNEVFDSDVCLYGEGYGAKIQKGGGNYIKDSQDFILFDIMINNWWLKREDIEIMSNKLGIKIVPIIGEGTLIDMISKCRQGFNSQWGDFKAEGIVARPKYELFSRGRQRIITKIKSKDFITN